MSRYIDMTGQRFGRLSVIGFSHIGPTGAAYWACKCDCGTIRVVRRSGLVSGRTKSCGCWHIEKSTMTAKDKFTTHGLSNNHKLYGVWKSMRQRCNCPTCHDYKWYGAQGKIVCKEWDDYSKFFEWSLTNGYEVGLTIDRINPHGNYEPQNCRWITIQEQQRNKGA